MGPVPLVPFKQFSSQVRYGAQEEMKSERLAYSPQCQIGTSDRVNYMVRVSEQVLKPGINSATSEVLARSDHELEQPLVQGVSEDPDRSVRFVKLRTFLPTNKP